MPIYALGSLPLLNITKTDYTKHAPYTGDIRNILTWWNKLNTFGSKIGHFPQANKSWLIGEPENYETVKRIFKDPNLNKTNESKRYFGTVLSRYR